MNQIKRALQNTKLTKKTLHKKFRPTQYTTTEQSKKITGFKNVNVNNTCNTVSFSIRKNNFILKLDQTTSTINRKLVYYFQKEIRQFL